MPKTSIKPQVGDSDKFTVTQAAKLLDVSRQTIHRHIEDKKLSPIIQKKQNATTSKEKRLKQYFSGKEIKRYWENY